MDITENNPPANAKPDSFNFFINLFDYGEFNEVVVRKEVDGYQVNLDDEIYLCTLARNNDHSWELVKGNIPASVVGKITQGMDRKLSN